MLKIIFVIAFFCCASVTTLQAQNSSASASQTIQLILYPTIDLKFTNTNTATGATVNMAFSNNAAYRSGVISGTQELQIRSNKNFKISVQADASNFAYSGNQNETTMPVNNTLFMAVTNNSTGGSVASAFNNSYNSLSSSSQELILNGHLGDDQKMVLAYKAKPDMSYPAGVYSVGVIYTATQP